ncbi:hypothetical protein [Gilvimarinus sp. 1_MG-2023]|uniref:hypothetical protein n=1 Tax=Gilvimarinus sp. 1_MG-2023 TaxID=3062638 RepID=UPI0026E31B7E|nr:hypothetical protein [Gilvimarinus sp. 1_MG-2023]MDO6748148.1 hypothetical protein [Gilvimarinus sp. 1_MG-2023]
MQCVRFGFLVILSGLLSACGGSSSDEGSGAISSSTSSSSSSTSISSSSSIDSSSSSSVQSSQSSSSVDSSSSSSAQSSQSSSSSEPSLLTGVFIDSAVANLDYQTASTSGQTSPNGEFQYAAGESVTFSIGDLQLPVVVGGSVITPMDLVGTADPRDKQVLNIVRLLLTLDKDGDSDNGIEIADEAKTVATQVDFTLSANAFASSAAVVNLIANAGQDSTVNELVSVDDAQAHFAQSLQLNGTENYVLQGTETIVASGAEPTYYGVSGIITLASDGNCYLSASEGYRAACTYDATSGELITDFATVTGTLGANSLTIIAKPNMAGGESVSAFFHASEEATVNVSAGTYSISGQELIAQNDSNPQGPDVTNLAGTFTINADGSCEISHNEGDISCQLEGSEIQGTGDAAGKVMGTATESELTIVYHSPGDELVYGYLIGSR